MATNATARLLLNLQMKTYKKTLITLFILEIVITFFISMQNDQENEQQSNFQTNPQFHLALSASNSSTTSSNQSFLVQVIRLSNIPINIIGIILVSIESLYFTLVYIPARYFFLYSLIRCTLNNAIYSCPLTVDLLLVLVVHMFYVKLYDDQYFWGSRADQDNDDRDSIVSDDDADRNSNIFSIDNHLHRSSRSNRQQYNQPPPSYSEVTNNPFKYPSLVVQVQEVLTSDCLPTQTLEVLNNNSNSNNSNNNIDNTERHEANQTQETRT